MRRPSNGPSPVARNWAIPARCLASQFWRNDQFRHFLAHRLRTRITKQALGRDVPFLDATVIVNDDDAIERRIEDRLTVLLAGGKLVLLFSRELPRRFHQEIAKNW